MSQQVSTDALKSKVADLKKDSRGPYHRITWYCKDGTQRESKDPCPEEIGGGIQHASFKDDVISLRKSNHLFFADILASLEKESFWDEENDHSRLKQYQLNKYLASVDDGWILRKGQYYRGAIQSEDEEAWGVDFYKWLLTKDETLTQNYFLIRQSLKDIPHNGDDNISQNMRSQSKTIADEFPEFMDLRIKIHGQPDRTDIRMVDEFESQYRSKLNPKLRKELDDLQETLRTYYAPIDINLLKQEINKLSVKNERTEHILDFLNVFKTPSGADFYITEAADMLLYIRDHITEFKSPTDRLILLDFSNDVEAILSKKSADWQPRTLKDLLEKISVVSCATVGTGLIEQWEWEKINTDLNAHGGKKELMVSDLQDVLQNARSIVEWSTSMVKANYQSVVNQYASFEPKAYGFIDDVIRSSLALDLGENVGKLGAYIAKESSLSNKVMQLPSQSSFRGLNPGYAYGELVVVSSSPDDIEVESDKIYVFQKPPSDLKPVAGIMTVSEGNLVSHVQLLARNLGIPNAALSGNNLIDLQHYNGQCMFYAVSNKGTVIVKPELEMTKDEFALFSKEQQTKRMIAVPVDQIRLDQTAILNMRDVNASDSGKSCGPKAANLGQLKSMFPEQVVEGLVIPFGIFRKHMDQPMPNTDGSYWKFLNTMFKTANDMRKNRKEEKDIETYQLEQLEQLRKAIENMSLDKDFVNSMRDNFKSVFGNSIGDVPVFLRSDTNMEDLKEFTGAGLNLTLFNILSEEAIMDGIKKVWASPYTERSFKWRQKYLSNPENVFPSILIIPSVDVDYSGVMITKGINSGNDDDLTVAFSRGAGGAVDGQSAETYLVTEKGYRLLAPARQPDYLRLPIEGGTKKYPATFESAILNSENIKELRKIAKAIRETLPEETKSDYQGAYDVELGFKDNKLWLFQIRPFVENKQAKSSEYLNSITPKVNYKKKLSLNATL
jgi:hypothetical protein